MAVPSPKSTAVGVFLSFTLLVCLLSPASGAPSDLPPVARLKARLADMAGRNPALEQAHVGIYAQALDSGTVLFARQPDTPMIPASNFKVLTVGVALARLGPDYRFETRLLGPPASGKVLKGNVVIVGSGDPTWVPPWTMPAEEVLEKFADDLARRGVKRIEGDIVGDDSAFDREFLGRGWKNRYLNSDYAAQAGGLSLNANIVHVDVLPDHIRIYPRARSIKVSRGTRKSGEVAFNRPLGTNDIKVSGGGRGGSSFNVHNPPMFVTTAFAEILAKRRIKVTGQARLIRDGETNDGLVLYASHKSMPLLPICRFLNKESDNFFAQHVFKAIGHRLSGKGTVETAGTAIYDFLEEHGIDTRGMVIADGCGLSVLNRITPRQMVEFLGVMARRPEASAFENSLAIAGKDGTMRYRLSGFDVKAKTGTIDGTVGLCGYVRTKAKQTVAFSIMVNHHRVGHDSVRAFQDEVVKAIALSKVRY